MLVVAVAGRPAAAQGAPRPVDALGTVHFAVSCSADAQARFDRAMALLHHMTYPQARTGFEQVIRLDPGCAMARWGLAMTLFQPLWPTRPTVDDIRRGRDALRAARALPPPSPREQLFLAAGEAFFRDPDSLAYWERVRGWQQGMERVHEAFPDDAEASVWLALADLAVAPAGATTHEQQDRAAALLLGVLRTIPDHPGAMHYLIHADDVAGREHESPEVVRRYQKVAPDNPHALHMPTHIYTRLGEWDAVIGGNLRAAAAALEHPAGDRGQYVWDEFPHAIEYLVYGYLQLGRDREALAQVRRLRRTADLEPSFKTAFHLASTDARYALERHAWREAAALPARRAAPSLDWDRFPWAEAVTWFARGMGASRLGRMAEARAASSRLDQLRAAAESSGEALFARQIEILRLGVDAWLAEAAGRPDSAAGLLRRAAEIEQSTAKPAVTPAPTLPARELLGDLLLKRGRPGEALAEYRRALELYPHRLNSLLGAARAARAAGQASASAGYYAQLLDLAGGGSRAEVIREARARSR